MTCIYSLNEVHQHITRQSNGIQSTDNTVGTQLSKYQLCVPTYHVRAQLPTHSATQGNLFPRMNGIRRCATKLWNTKAIVCLLVCLLHFYRKTAAQKIHQSTDCDEILLKDGW